MIYSPKSPASRNRRQSTLIIVLRGISACLSLQVILLLLGADASASDADSQLSNRLGLPPTAAPASGEEIALAKLGAHLFEDVRLSASGKVSCATCHIPDKAFADGRTVGIGNNGQPTTRNVPTLFNVAFERHLFWDGRVKTLEEQALAPLMNPREHALPSEQAIIEIVRSSPTYAREVDALADIRGRKLGIEDVARALAAFERTLVAGGSAFDLYYFGGRTQALSESAMRGLDLFQGRAQCATCHLIEKKQTTFSDGDFHVSGRMPNRVVSNLAILTKQLMSVAGDRAAREFLVSSDANVAALGRFVATLDPNDIGKFKTPSLRNVALTAPYMHDGSIPTLAEVIDRELYNRTAAGNYPIALTLTERADLRAFLESLTSPAATLQ